MNTYFSIPEPLFVLQISQLPKVAQNWFCIQNLHMELSFQKKKEILKSVHWFRRNLTNKHLNVFFETPCSFGNFYSNYGNFQNFDFALIFIIMHHTSSYISINSRNTLDNFRMRCFFLFSSSFNALCPCFEEAFFSF